MFKGKARAYTNIALIKYWGKKNETLILPMNNSLSLTLDAFYTETEILFSEEFTEDRFYLDDQLQDEKATKKISAFLDLARKKAGIAYKATITSQNFVPTAAGLASSASGLPAFSTVSKTPLAFTKRVSFIYYLKINTFKLIPGIYCEIKRKSS